MPPNIFISQIDTTGLNAALSAASVFAKRTPSVAVNTAMFFVMRGTVREVPKVSVQTINSELGVQVNPVFNKNGRVSKNKRRKYETATFNSGISVKPPIPFVALLISARAKRNSRYNQLTGGRYALAQHPLKGINPRNTSLVKSIMDAFARRMSSGRRSSIAFMASGILPVIRGLEANIEPRYRRGAPQLDAQARIAYGKSSEDKGAVTVAREGSNYVFCLAELLIGMKGKNAKAHNEAMFVVIGPVLRRQVNIEAEKTFKKVAEWEALELQKQCRSFGAT